MPMTRSTAVGSIVVGSIELTFAIIAIVCGAITSEKLSDKAAASAGLWALFYAVPGILTIIAGASKNIVVMAFALFFNIIAVILSFCAAGLCIALAIILDDMKDNYICHTISSECFCTKRDGFSYDTETFNMNCGDIDTIHTIMLVAAIVYSILTVTTFTASIYGCLGTCCVPRDPVVVVTGGVPVQAGNTVVVQSSQHTAMQAGYPGPGPAMYAPPPAMGAPPNYDKQYGDNNPLVKNMAI